MRQGIGEPVRGSGCRVRVGVVERGGVLERLWHGVPPMGEGECRCCVRMLGKGNGRSRNEVDILPSIMRLLVGCGRGVG